MRTTNTQNSADFHVASGNTIVASVMAAESCKDVRNYAKPLEPGILPAFLYCFSNPL